MDADFIENALTNAAISFTTITETSAGIPLSSLSGFDAVIWSGETFPLDNPTTSQSLFDYWAAGGGIILISDDATWNFGSPNFPDPTFTYPTHFGITHQNVADNGPVSAVQHITRTTAGLSHPVTKDVSNFDTFEKIPPLGKAGYANDIDTSTPDMSFVPPNIVLAENTATPPLPAIIVRGITPDADGDGVPDYDDACPAIFGLLADGCPPLPPVASFTATPNPAAPSQSITFDGTSSSDPNNDVVTYEWDFNYDGTTFTVDATGSVVSHSYTSFGSRTVALRVTDATSLSDLTTLLVKVNLGNNPPTANAGGPYTTETGLGITLDGSASFDPDASAGDSIVQYEWDLNSDGTFDATGVNPTISASTLSALGLGVGTHPIVLKVTDTFGAIDTDTTTLDIVMPARPDVYLGLA